MNTYNDPSAKVAPVYGGSATYGGTIESQEPQIKQAFSELEKEIYVLQESLSGLGARLESVMLPEMPKANRDNPPIVNSPHSDLYNRINNLRGTLVDLNIFLSNIKQRLEV